MNCRNTEGYKLQISFMHLVVLTGEGILQSGIALTTMMSGIQDEVA